MAGECSCILYDLAYSIDVQNNFKHSFLINTMAEMHPQHKYACKLCSFLDNLWLRASLHSSASVNMTSLLTLELFFFPSTIHDRHLPGTLGYYVLILSTHGNYCCFMNQNKTNFHGKSMMMFVILGSVTK